MRFLLVLLLALLGACGPRPSGEGGGIVSLTPSLTETLFDLGVGDRIVAVTENDTWPPQVASLPKVGSMHPDYEKIVALRPSLVVADSGLLAPEAVDRLRGLGLEVLTVHTKSLDELSRNMVTLGDALGVPEAGRQRKAELDAALARVETEAARLERRPRVFVEIQAEPLITVGGGGLVSEMVRRAGGDNLYADLSDPYPTISVEDLVRRDPEVIVLIGGDPAAVASRPGWEGLSAVRSGRVHLLDPDLLVRPTLRAVQGLERLQAWFRP